MRILFVAPRFHTNQYQMVKTLQEKNHEVFFHVASLGSTEDHSLITPTRYRQSRISLFVEKIFGRGGVNRPNYFPDPFSYWRIFKKLHPEIVIIRDPYRFFSLLVAFSSIFIKAKIIFYTQEELYRSRNMRTRLKKNLTMRFFNAAWMIPIKGKENIEKNKLKHMYYVPIPIPIKSTNHYKKTSIVGEPKILMVGKYHQDRKKHILLLNAISVLKDKYRFKVTIVGECIREQQLAKFEIIKETVNSLGLNEIVELKKNVPFSQMEALYSSHDFFVLPAIDEQYGVSVTEALGYGLPAICTDTCGAKFNIVSGENGFVIKSNSLEDLVMALEAFISNKENSRKMSEKCLYYVQSNLSGNAFYARFSHLVNDRFSLQIN